MSNPINVETAIIRSSVSLDGKWSFTYGDGPAGREIRSGADVERAGLACTVPGNFELDLQANDIIEEPFYSMNIVGLRKYENTNDTRGGVESEYKVTDVDTGEVLAGGCATAAPDAVTLIDRIPFSAGRRRFYAIKWTGSLGTGSNHYLAGNPPFSLVAYRRWLESLSP